jgi:hypothetical protein
MRRIAEEFASALDDDQFERAASLLGQDCCCRMRDREIRGRGEVMQSFIDASAWAHARIERVAYTHAIEYAGERVATIRFFDDFEHGGSRIHHESLMHLTLGADGLIERLVLDEPPGEREGVMTLLREAGVEI